jgi:3-hydroxyisobutyrate dehydrogenase-like beta-hydroxyacid dehydrogenase
MGSSVGYSAIESGNEVFWASEHRSARSAKRAARAGLTDLKQLSILTAECELLISICPPKYSFKQAETIRASGFRGIYLEANAISPMATKTIGNLFDSSPISYVDGGIVGAPAWNPGTTRLYLSGKRGETVHEALTGGPLQPIYLGPDIGAASAMKMCYAAYTKGHTALVASILSAAYHFGVEQPLLAEWGEETTAARIANIQRITGRAWRWVDEMEQIADTMAEAGLHDGIHRAAADLYSRLEEFKDCEPPPEWAEILAALKKH